MSGTRVQVRARSDRPRVRIDRRAIGALVAAALALGACGSDDSSDSDDTGGDATTAPSATTTPTVTTTATATTTPADTTGPIQPTTSTVAPSTDDELSAADVDAITVAFETFFGGQASTLDAKVAVLEEGEFYRDMLEAASANEQFQEMTTDIREVRAASSVECADLSAQPGCAIVVHDLLVGGFPMATELESPAVLIDGEWSVGWRAWCNAVEIGGATCPAPEDGNAA